MSMLEFIHRRFENYSDVFMSELIILWFLLQVLIVKLKMDKDRKKILDRRAEGKRIAEGKSKGKHTEESIAMETS